MTRQEVHRKPRRRKVVWPQEPAEIWWRKSKEPEPDPIRFVRGVMTSYPMPKRFDEGTQIRW